MSFHTYIRAVGTGKKINRDLNFDESSDAMHQILKGLAYPEQISAFLLGWRLKPETVTEFKGALNAFDSYIKFKHIENSIEIGYPFDGKVKNPYIFPLTNKILKKANLNLVLTGDELISTKNGTTVKNICTQMQTESNIYYFDRKDFFKEMHNLTQIRMRLGLRTGLNTLEKLTGVASSQYAITGVFHKPYVKKYIELFANKYKRLAIIQGNEGTPEIFSKSRLWLTQNEKTEEIIIDPEYYGIKYKRSQKKINKEESLIQTTNPSNELLKIATLNAAVFLFVADKAKNIKEAYEITNG